MTDRRADFATVDLLHACTSSEQQDSYRPDDPRTWQARGQLLTPEQVERVRRSTAPDWDALDALLAVDRALLAMERADVADRLRASGLHDVAQQLPELQ